MGPLLLQKILLLFLFWLFVQFEAFRFNPWLSLFSAGFAGMFVILLSWIIPSWRSSVSAGRIILHLPGTIFLSILFLAGIRQLPDPGRFPDGMTLREKGQIPDYDRIWLVDAQIVKRVNSKSLIARVTPHQFLQKEYKTRRYPVFPERPLRSQYNKYKAKKRAEKNTRGQGKEFKEKNRYNFARAQTFYRKSGFRTARSGGEKKALENQEKREIRENQENRSTDRKAGDSRSQTTRVQKFRTYTYSYYQVKKTYNEGEKEKYSFRLLLQGLDPPAGPGCRIRLKMYGRAIPEKATGGYKQYLKRKRVLASVRPSKKYHIQKVDCDGTPSIRERLRSQILLLLEESGMSEQAKTISAGMVLGDSSFMDYEQKQKGKKLGILHLFAASGLHLAIFFGVMYVPLSVFLGKKHPLALWLPLIPSFAYIWFLSFPVSLLRAFLFIVFFSMKSVLHRRLTTGDRIVNAALITAFFLPEDSFSLSGYLSFAAVSGILYYYTTIESALPRWKSKLLVFFRSQIALSSSASLFTSPLILSTFGIYPFAGLIANVFLVPFAGLVLPLLYIGIGFSMMLPEFFRSTIWFLPSLGMNVFARAVETIEPYSLTFQVANPFTFAGLLVWSLIAIVVLLGLKKRGGRLARNLKRIPLKTVLLVLLFAGGPVAGMLSYWTWLVLPEYSPYTGVPVE